MAIDLIRVAGEENRREEAAPGAMPENRLIWTGILGPARPPEASGMQSTRMSRHT